MVTSPEVSNLVLRAELGIQLKGLHKALAVFTHYLQTEARDALDLAKAGRQGGCSHSPAPDISLDLIAQVLNDIRYIDGQHPHEIPYSTGILVLSEEGLYLAGKVKRQKHA